jgi:putative flippase GtrA
VEALRFTAVAMAGVVVDIAISLALVEYAGLPLWIAAVGGFTVAAIANYGAHELWTFRSGAQELSFRRAARFLLASTLTLLVRLAVVYLLGSLIGVANALPILVGAVGVSFIINFLISKFLVFSRNVHGTRGSL